jgi:hypothetical protein
MQEDKQTPENQQMHKEAPIPKTDKSTKQTRTKTKTKGKRKRKKAKGGKA